jgi:hypothetical protein
MGAALALYGTAAHADAKAAAANVLKNMVMYPPIIAHNLGRYHATD